MSRLFLSMLIAAIAVLAAVYVVASMITQPGVAPMAQMLVVLAIPIVLATLLVICVPLALLAVRRRWLNHSSFLVGGAIASAPAVVATLVAEPGGSVQALNSGVVPMTVLLVSLALSSLTWLLGVRGNTKL